MRCIGGLSWPRTNPFRSDGCSCFFPIQAGAKHCSNQHGLGRCKSQLLMFHCLQNDVAALLKPISEKIQEIQMFRERNRGSAMFNHLSAVSESIPALGWIAVVSQPPGGPAPLHLLRCLGICLAAFRPLRPQSHVLRERSF